MRRSCLVFVFISTAALNVHAQEMKAMPLSPPSALLVDSAGDRQSATIEKFGQVSIREISLAKKIDASDSKISEVQQHAKYYDFFMVPLKFGVLGFDGKACRWLQFGATLKVAGADASQAFILNVFPETSLKEGSFQADAKVGISSDLKLATPDALPASGSVGIGGAANVAWKWSPLYQSVAVAHDQSRSVWRFDAVGPQFPTGVVEVATIVAIAKDISKGPKTKIAFDVELRASFGGGWFDRAGLARANAIIVGKLP